MDEEEEPQEGAQEEALAESIGRANLEREVRRTIEKARQAHENGLYVEALDLTNGTISLEEKAGLRANSRAWLYMALSLKALGREDEVKKILRLIAERFTIPQLKSSIIGNAGRNLWFDDGATYNWGAWPAFFLSFVILVALGAPWYIVLGLSVASLFVVPKWINRFRRNQAETKWKGRVYDEQAKWKVLGIDFAYSSEELEKPHFYSD